MCGVTGSIALAVVWVLFTLSSGMTQMDMLTINKPTKCTYEVVYNMHGATCVGLKLQHIPYLKTRIEILDFSDNKLNEIKADTFTSYTSLKFLYLNDNKIYKIHESAFSPLSSLQSLDLSSNSIFELPESIFHLPSLQRLYLNDMPSLHHSMQKLSLQHPITAPLEKLEISGCGLEALPTWGIMPHLTDYNISHNSLTTLEPGHFAPLCNLVKVDLTNSIDIILETQVCKIKPTIIWLQSKSVSFLLDDYSKLNTNEFEDCPMANFEVNLNHTYHRCKEAYTKFQSHKSSRRTWLTVTGGLAGFLVGFMLLLYIMHRHNVAQTKTKAEKMKNTIPSNDRDVQAMVPILAANEHNIDVTKL